MVLPHLCAGLRLPYYGALLRDGEHGGADDQAAACWQYGAVVFWGLDEAEQLFFLRFIQDFEEDAVGLEEQERDDMTFFYAPRSVQVSFAVR